MLERRSLPGFGCVAQRAVTPKLTAMHIILDVTADTVRRRAAEDIVDMALLAFHLHMLTRQLERRQVVIKDFGWPALRIMAAGTVGAKVRRMGIVLQMTSSTVGWGVFESGQARHPWMAVNAAILGMLAQQWKGQLVMVKPVF